MRIGLCSIYHFSQYPGGNERYTHELALALVKLGHQVYYFTGSDIHAQPFPYQIVSLKIFHFHSKPLPLPNKVDLKKIPLDVFHTTGSGLPLHFLARQLNKHHLHTVHTFQANLHPTNFLANLGAKLEARLIGTSYQHLVVTTPYYQNLLAQKYPHLKITQIPLMLPTAFQSTTLHKPYPTRDSLIFVGTLDQHHYYKGLDLLLQALTLTTHPLTLTIVGSGSLLSTYQNLARQLKLSHRVKFTGHVSDRRLVSLYRQACLYVQPSTSDSEGFGLSLLEAMALNIPVLATTAAAGSTWFAQKGLITTVVPHAPALSQAIMALLERPPLAKINRAAKYAHSLTPAHIAKQTLKIYSRL